MNKIYQNFKAGHCPTTSQMRLLHWLTQLELSGNTQDEAVEGLLQVIHKSTKKE